MFGKVSGALKSIGSAIGGIFGMGPIAGGAIGGIVVVLALVLGAGVFGLGIGASDPALYDALEDPCKEEVDELRESSGDEVDGEEQMMENAKKLYSAFKVATFDGEHLSDMMIAAMLANFQNECSIDPTTIEGDYTMPYRMEGEKKRIATDKGAMDAWAHVLFGKYHAQGISFNQSAYYAEGQYWVGIGITSSTGPGTIMLEKGAASVNRDWWDFDYQAAYCLANPERPDVYKQYLTPKAMRAHGKDPDSPDDCSNMFVEFWEGVPALVRGENEFWLKEGAERRDDTRKWYDKIKGWTVDQAYANKIIEMAKRLSYDGTASAAGDKARDCEEAEENTSVGNLAEALVAESYSQRKTFGEGYPGTDIYKQAFEATLPGDGYFRSCCRGVSVAVRWCGADVEMPAGGPGEENAHCKATPDKWQFVKVYHGTQTGPGGASEAKAAGLQPGDLLLTQSASHAMAYVGEEAVAEGYEKYLRGKPAPHGGDCGTPEDGSAWVSASIGSDGAASTYDSGPSSGRAPCIGTGGDACNHDYDVFRFIGSSYDDRYKDAVEGIALGDGSGGGGLASVSGEAGVLISNAEATIGTKWVTSGYVWTGSKDTSEITCSGLVDLALGYPPRTHWPESFAALIQSNGTWTTDPSKLKPGDVCCHYFADRKPGHVSIYLGNGKVLESTTPVVMISDFPGSCPFIGGGTLPSELFENIRRGHKVRIGTQFP